MVCNAIPGDQDHALEWLHNTCKGHSAAICFMGLDPDLESLHGDPRFDDQIGLRCDGPGALIAI